MHTHTPPDESSLLCPQGMVGPAVAHSQILPQFTPTTACASNLALASSEMTQANSTLTGHNCHGIMAASSHQYTDTDTAPVQTQYVQSAAVSTLQPTINNNGLQFGAMESISTSTTVAQTTAPVQQVHSVDENTMKTPASSTDKQLSANIAAPIYLPQTDTVTSCTSTATSTSTTVNTIPASTAKTAEAIQVTSATAPIVVIRQMQVPKPYNGNTSWKSFKDHFERVARANNWTSNAEKVQNLTLSLDGQAADVLKEIDETSPTAYTDIWEALKQRFGKLDEPREAMRRFENRKQHDTESISDFAMQLRLLFREAWPHATSEHKEATLKRRFEDGLLSIDMSQFLRLHARSDDFTTTVLKARQFADAAEATKPKKSVKFITTPDHGNVTSDNTPQPNFQPLLDGFATIMQKYLPRTSRSPSPSIQCISNDRTNSDRSRQSQRRDNSGTNTSQRSQPTGQSYQRDERRSMSHVARPTTSQGQRSGAQGPRNEQHNQRTQSPTSRSQYSANTGSRFGSPGPQTRNSNQDYRPTGPSQQRSQSQGPRSGQRFSSPGPRYGNTQPNQFMRRQQGSGQYNQTRPQSPVGQAFRQPPLMRGPATTASGELRQPGTCWICGTQGCGTNRHDDQNTYRPRASNSVPQSGNDTRSPATGVRAPAPSNRP